MANIPGNYRQQLCRSRRDSGGREADCLRDLQAADRQPQVNAPDVQVHKVVVAVEAHPAARCSGVTVRQRSVTARTTLP